MLKDELNTIYETTKVDYEKSLRMIQKITKKMTKNCNEIFHYEVDLMNRSQDMIGRAIAGAMFMNINEVDLDNIKERITPYEMVVAFDRENTTDYFRNASDLISFFENEIQANTSYAHEIEETVEASLQCIDKLLLTV